MVRHDSIRAALLFWLLLALAAGLAVAAGAVYVQAREDANALFDFHLREVVASLPGRAFPAIAANDGAVLEDGTVVQIWDASGARLYFSHPRALLPARAELGFTTVDTPSGAWRVYSAIVGSNVVQAAQPMRVRRTMAAGVALRTLWPFLALLPVLGAAILVLVRRGLAPLDDLARDVARRSERSLEPVPVGAAPEEVRPLVHALNDLLQRLEHSLATQRAFVADAAHELRTPLAALRLQSQLVERAPDDAARREALGAMGAGLARAAHLVEQLLTLARQEPGASGATDLAPCRLADLAREAVASRAVLAVERGIDLGVGRQDEGRVAGSAGALAILLGNLVDNALRYTPSGGRVDVEVLRDGDALVLAVSDTGPGIPPEERERVFDRFYRLPGSPGAGSGLGLAIVRRIAEAHGAEVVLDERAGGGLVARVRFAAAP